MGINPIQYHPWKGERGAQNLRVYVILRSAFRHLMKSMGVKALLILAFVIIYAFQFIMVPMSPHERLEADEMNANFSGLTLAIFAMLLAAVVTSGLISEDLSGSSFVLYFSRAIRTRDYLIGKSGGATLVMSFLCAIPPVLLAVISIVTQSGSDYLHSMSVLGRTAVAGALATVFFVPYGMMMSSFTTRKSYAAIGTFMSFFVLTIIAEVFSEFDQAWRVISPLETLSFTFDWIFAQPIPSFVNESALLGFLTCFTVIPAFVLYVMVQRKAVGK
ncbi:MAG: ABC transporter permease [Thermoplasmata archaeon]|nr:ABC transporter permease [Thermoplasmata archaeon]